MSVNIKRNGALLKLGGLYQGVIAALASLIDTNISSPSNGQILKYNSTTSKWENTVQDIYLDQTATTSTTDPTVYTFTDARITANSVIDVYADIFGVCPSSVVASAGTCTVTFPKQDTAATITCRIYIK